MMEDLIRDDLMKSSGWRWFCLGVLGGFALVSLETALDGIDDLTAVRLAPYAGGLIIAALSMFVSPAVRAWLYMAVLICALMMAVFLLFVWFYPLHFLPATLMAVAFSISIQEHDRATSTRR
ncbi:MAG TPA: hypothetical protein VFH62_08285 [Dehalococcoidia bacterium]|jgi:hypothetical protein|nr:hypothetical protein [Dehalococcoidia bacterium]